jgi:two-component system chemotaxis response regulator CheB
VGVYPYSKSGPGCTGIPPGDFFSFHWERTGRRGITLIKGKHDMRRIATPRAHIVVIGASLGGLEALSNLAAQFPKTFRPSIFVVQHLSPQTSGEVLAQRMSQDSVLPCSLARHGESFRPGRIYISPPDYHMLLKDGTILVTKGARENRSRPSIDPLFRSAAVAHGAGVVGVVLTGMLNDGTAGLSAIKRCGGVTVIQDPKDAAYPDMPRNAAAYTKVDYSVPLSSMGALLERLDRRRLPKANRIPADIALEAVIAERVLSDVSAVNRLGEQVPYNCPNCGGVLWRMD